MNEAEKVSHYYSRGYYKGYMASLENLVKSLEIYEDPEELAAHLISLYKTIEEMYQAEIGKKSEDND